MNKNLLLILMLACAVGLFFLLCSVTRACTIPGGDLEEWVQTAEKVELRGCVVIEKSGKARHAAGNGVLYVDTVTITGVIDPVVGDTIWFAD